MYLLLAYLAEYLNDITKVIKKYLVNLCMYCMYYFHLFWVSMKNVNEYLFYITLLLFTTPLIVKFIPGIC